jgi:predicted transcriptional regulator
MTALTTTRTPLLAALDEYLESVHHAERLAALAPLERKLERATRRWFRAQSVAFRARFARLARFYEAALPNDWEGLFDDAAAEVVGPFRTSLVELVTEAMRLGWDRAQATHAVSMGFQVTNPAVSAYLRGAGGERITAIDTTTKDVIRGILSQAADEGWTYQQTAKAITAKYASFGGAPLTGAPAHIRTRAQLVAVTELGDAYSAADMALARDLQATGETMMKSVETADDPCEDCQMNADDGWIPLDDAFSTGDDAPTFHPGCRCSLASARAQDL